MYSTKTFSTGFFVAFALLLSGSSGQAQQQPAMPGAAQAGAFTMGELGRRMSYGSDGKWQTTATDDGAVVIKSLGDDESWTASTLPAPDRPYTIDIKLHSDIAPQAGHAVGGGVVFGLKRGNGGQGPKFYSAVIAGKTLFVYAWDNGHISQLIRSENTNNGQAAVDSLKINVSGKNFTVSLNNNGSLSQSVSEPISGESGIFVSGTGRVLFRDLQIQ